MSNAPMQVVCGLVITASRVLATRRDGSRHFPLLWEFPGGKVEAGESPEAALLRELEEELKLSVRIVAPLEPVFYEEDSFSMNLIPFLCVPAQDHGVVPVDHSQIRWIKPEESGHLEWAPADVPLLKSLPEWVARIPD